MSDTLEVEVYPTFFTSPPVLRIFDVPPLLTKEMGTKGVRYK